MCRLSAIIVAVVLCASSSLWAYSSPNVPIDRRVYKDIDKLVASKLVSNVIYGQRPWSRNEIARIIAVALRNREAADQSIAPNGRESLRWMYMDSVLEYLKKEYREELIEQGVIEGEKKTTSFRPLEYVQAEYTFLDNDLRNIHDNGQGRINAVVSPLTAYEEGRRYPDGHQLAVETESWLRASRFFSMYLRPRFQLSVTHGGDASLRPYVQQLYAKFAVPHFELEVGRDSIEWGQGEFGGVLLSNNARPLDLIKISNPSPSQLPWVFKHLGHWRYTFFVANMGPEREFPYAYLTGIKISLKPASFFEIGFSQLMLLGGDGSPGSYSAGGVIREFFGGRSSGRNRTNRQAGFDMRFFLPFLRNTQIYLDIQFEDDYYTSLEKLKFQFGHLASYHTGIYFPRLDYDGRMSLRLEYLHGSPYFYRHAPYVTGMALNGKILGNEVGPDSDAAYVTFSYDYSRDLWFSFLLKYELRDGDDIQEFFAPNRQIITVLDRPDESRFGISANVNCRIKKSWELLLEAGYEHVNSYNFIAGEIRENFLLRAGLRYHAQMGR